MEAPPQKFIGNCRMRQETIRGVGCIFLHPSNELSGRKLIFLHGGAFTSGPIICHWGMLSRVCEKTGIAAIMVDYGLVPAHRYPGPLNDVLQVFRQLRLENPQDRIFLMGDSAGGGLALSAALALKNNQAPLPQKLGLLSPWLDLTMSHPDIERLKKFDQLLTKEDLIAAGRDYAGDHNPGHHLLSPINGDFAGLPPALVLVGTHELFLCDCRRFKEKAEAAGVPISYKEWKGMFHDWMALTPAMAEANEAVDEIVDFFSKA